MGQIKRMPPHIAQRKRWYGTQRWKRLRTRILKNKPMCSVCRLVVADSVDHIEHRLDNSMFWDTANLRPICRPCNSARRPDGSGGSSKRSGKEFATLRGTKETDTAQANPDPITDIFNRAKEARNAKPNDVET